MSRGKCCCVTTDACEAPANFPGLVATKCWNCGDFVCRACSRLVVWKGRTLRAVRLCDDCREELGTQVGHPVAFFDLEVEAEIL